MTEQSVTFTTQTKPHGAFLATFGQSETESRVDTISERKTASESDAVSKADTVSPIEHGHSPQDVLQSLQPCSTAQNVETPSGENLLDGLTGVNQIETANCAV